MPDTLAPPAPPPLLTGEDLDDEDQFVTVRRVPLLDVHDDPEHGPVDEALLQLIAKNSNALVAKGHYPALALGHTRAKQTVVVHDGDRKITRPGADELQQPPVIGHATAFHVAPFDGRPCLHADFHIHAKDADYARSFPFRSVERLEANDGDPSGHVVDRIAMLRTAPRRDLGVLRYERDALNPRRICYARDFPPMGDVPVSEPDSPPPTTPPLPGANAMADNATAPPPAATDAPPAAAAPPQTVGSMTVDDLKALVGEVVNSVLSAAMQPDEGDQPPDDGADPDADASQYDANEQLDPMAGAEQEEQPMQYEAAEPGGGDTFIPGGVPADKERKMYAKITRENKDRDEMLVLLSDKVLDLEHRERRHNYERSLIGVRDEGYALDDEGLAEHLERLKPGAPATHEAETLQTIRKHYARRAGNLGVPVAGVTISPSQPDEITLADRQKAIGYASRNAVSFTEALKAVRGK